MSTENTALFTVDEALSLLTAAEVFFEPDEDDDPKLARMLNLNDAFFWACSDGEYVSDEDAPRVAELFFRYGRCGVWYWVVVEKRDGSTAEFMDVNRAIEFVRNEEAFRVEFPDSTKRAYTPLTYMIGEIKVEDAGQ